MKFSNLLLAAQTSYAELYSQTQAFEMSNALAGLKGSFHKRSIKGSEYWYFAYRDIDQKVRMVYIGPESDRVRALVDRFEQIREDKPLAPPARMAIAAGCVPAAPKHFRIIKRLSEYGFFRAGGILVGSHAFVALGNMLGFNYKLLRLPSIDRWGDISYGLYIYAFPVQQTIAYVIPGLRPMNMFILSTFITFVLAVMSWRLIEKPALKLKGKIRYGKHFVDVRLQKIGAEN